MAFKLSHLIGVYIFFEIKCCWKPEQISC